MSQARPTILFSPVYAEPLKAMLPYMEALRSDFDVFVLNTVSWVDDREKSERIIREAGLPFASEDETAAAPPVDNSLLRVIRGADFRARRITGGVLHEAIGEYARERRWRSFARNWLDRLHPTALVVGGEQNPIQKHLIAECNRRSIPSITLQWGIANASRRHTVEMLERRRLRERTTLSRLGRARQRLVTRMGQALVRASGLAVPMPSEIFGGGHASSFAVIGDGCFANYREMGIPASKMVVIGYPIYERLYREADRLTTDKLARAHVIRRLRLQADQRVILWCTNDQRGYYGGIRSYEEMLNSWRSKLDVLLRAANCSVVVKLHPKEKLADYVPLLVSDRVRLVCDEGSAAGSSGPADNHIIIEDFEVRDILPHAALVVTRFSGTAVDALCLGRPVITHNAPQIPGGTLYEDLGGTLHAKDDAEFADFVEGVLGDGRLLDDAATRRADFLRTYVRIEEEPASERFVRLVTSLIDRR